MFQLSQSKRRGNRSARKLGSWIQSQQRQKLMKLKIRLLTTTGIYSHITLLIMYNFRRLTFGYSVARRSKFWSDSNNRNKNNHRGTFTNNVPPLIRFKMETADNGQENDENADYGESDTEEDHMEHSKIDELSEEIKDSNDNNTKYVYFIIYSILF